jgi:hypothetical protein
MRIGGHNIVKSVMEWKPLGKRSRGRPRKRWIDTVEEYLRNIGIDTWTKLLQDKDRW